MQVFINKPFEGRIKKQGLIKLMKKILMKRIYLGIIILLSVIGGVIAIYSTTNGPWGGSDPVAYISSAYSLLNGKGLGYYEASTRFTFLTWYPPFYPVMLSAIGLTGMNLVAAARWLNVLSFAASIFIAGWIFLRFSRIPALGVIASALMLSFPYMLEMFSSSYSEPLFILLYLLSGLCLLIYLRKEKTVLLAISALVLGLVPITRYAGIAMLASGILGFFFFTSGKIWPRIKKTSLFALIASLPTILWFIWVYLITNHSVGGRTLPGDSSNSTAMFQSFRLTFTEIFWKWIPFQNMTIPPQYRVRLVSMSIGLIIVIALSILVQLQVRENANPGDKKSDPLVLVYFGVSSLAFVTFLAIAYLFIQTSIALDNRMFLPLFVGLVMGLLGTFATWQTAWFSDRRRLLQVLPWLVGILCVYSYLPQMQQIANDDRHSITMTSYYWSHSTVIQAVRALPANTPVISNGWELLMLWTQRPINSYWVLSTTTLPIQTTTSGTNPRKYTQSVFCKRGAALVIFNIYPTQLGENVGENSIHNETDLFTGLSQYETYQDGTIYFCS
jgi:hypothetical protein